MFVKQNKSHKGILLTYTIGYRENGKVKHKNVETIGYLEDLKKIYVDPITHFRELARKKSNDDVNALIIKNINSLTIEEGNSTKNLGYVILKKIYKELDIENTIKSETSKLKINYDIKKIFELLVFSRILFPNSKLSTYNNRNIFFENYNFTEQNMYRALDYIYTLKNQLLKSIWENTKETYKRDTSITYYDTTNYYFEISYNDEDIVDENGNIIKQGTRKKGPSKEHRKTPIIGMGLLMDKNGLPMSYDLFPGNISEKQEMRPTLKKVKAKFGIDRTIIVADRGQNTSDNIFFIAGKNDDVHINHDGYVYGQSILSASNKFKDWVLNQEGYFYDQVINSDGSIETYKEVITNDKGEKEVIEKPVIFKHKSRVVAKTVTINRDGKRKNKVTVYQKQMIYFSKKYADRQKHEREKAIEKAKDLIANPSKYTQATSYGCTKYINNIIFNEETGEVQMKLDLSLKEDIIEEESKFDGYYSIVTSEKNLSDKEIRDIYKGLWKIEQTFKITKSEIQTRPVFVWTPESIEAHFLSCFISLLIIRLLEYKLEYKYSTEKIIESIRNYTSTKVEHDIYIQNFTNDIIKDLSKVFDIDLSKKYLSISKIKKILNF